MDLLLFERQLGEWGIKLGSRQLERLLAFGRVLSAYREANVIGVRDPDEILMRHILDSLSGLYWEPLRRATLLVDVGSGGGLPGIPLKIVLAGAEVTLIEATAKKVRFMQRAVGDLGLAGVTVVNARAEAVGQDPSFREKFEIAITRAVGPLAIVLEYCAPLVRRGGTVLAMKGHLENDELRGGDRAATALGLEAGEVIPVPWLKETEVENRNLVLFKKIKSTPDAYPRRPGLAKKRPLSGG